MGSETRKFIPEVETVWHKDYQCDYYRGVVIDDNDRIVVRCAELHPDSGHALRDAEKKIALSPLYSRQTTPEMQAKLEEYRRQILEVMDITEKKNRDSRIQIRYVKYNNLSGDWRKSERKTTITVKRKWPFYNELMEYFVFVSQNCSYQYRQASPREES